MKTLPPCYLPPCGESSAIPSLGMPACQSPCWAVSFPTLVPHLLILVFPEINLVSNRESTSTMGPGDCHHFLQPPVCPSSTKYLPTYQGIPSLQNHLRSTNLHCQAAQELRVQDTNIETSIPPVMSCVTSGNYLTSLCLAYKMGKMVPNHRIIVKIRGINTCNAL